MVLIEWKARNDTPFKGKVKDYIAETRNIPDMDLFLNPTSEVVHDPLKMKNMKEATDRVIRAIENNEKIGIYADIDPDGVLSTTIMYDYIKRNLGGNAKILYHQRSEGHGVIEDKVPNDIDLLIVMDSSSSETEVCRSLSENMDIVIIDHHIIDVDNPYGIIVNPQQEGCEYPNKSVCTGVLAFKFVEVMDFHFKQKDVHNYLDLVLVTLLADSMDMSVLENRYFAYEGLKNIRNIGLLALIKSKKTTPDKVDSNFLSYQAIPIINTTTRNDEIEKAFKLFLQQDFKTAKKMADWLSKDNDKRKEMVKELMEEYESIMDNDKIIYVVAERAKQGYNGLVAQKLSSKYKKPALVLKDMGEEYKGSFRSYENFDLLTFLKNCPYSTFAAGHAPAGGCSIKAEHFDKLKPYVEDGLSEISFDPVIKYDLEIDEDDLSELFEEDKPNFELVKEIEELNYVSGNGFNPITIRINGVDFQKRELFGKEKNHTKITAKHFDIKKFNDSEYGDSLTDWDFIDVLGHIDINDFGGKKRIQLIVEDYKIH